MGGGPVSSAGSTPPLSLLCRRSVSSVLGLEFHQYNLLGPEKCLDSNSLPNITKFFAVPTFLVKRMHLLQSGHCYENHQLEQLAPMDRLLISRAFLHTLASCHLDRDLNSAHVSENASETQIDATMTFTVLIVSIEQNKEFQESRGHYLLPGS